MRSTLGMSARFMAGFVSDYEHRVDVSQAMILVGMGSNLHARKCLPVIL